MSNEEKKEEKKTKDPFFFFKHILFLDSYFVILDPPLLRYINSIIESLSLSLSCFFYATRIQFNSRHNYKSAVLNSD